MKKISFLLLSLIIITSCDNTIDNNNFIPDEFIKTIDTDPDWSHNGRYIAYVHFAQDSVESIDGGVQIRILDLDSLTTTFLTVGYSPKWSPDDRFIVYEIGGNIYKINVGTKITHRLTDWGNCYFPSWSADGKKIAFDSNQFDPKGANVIWIMNADGTSKKDISEHGIGEWREPNWSPEGSKILYSRFIGIGTPELFLMDTSGQNHFRLTYNNYEDRYTDWSNDGSKIAWNSGEEDNIGIWTMNSDGSNPNFLVKWGGFPSWSPDGNKIVYYSVIPATGNGTIWIINIVNGNKKQLFKYPK